MRDGLGSNVKVEGTIGGTNRFMSLEDTTRRH